MSNAASETVHSIQLADARRVIAAAQNDSLDPNI